MRVGAGIDVHAFEQGIPLWLGGVLIEHDRGLAGHSDGDAAVHALIDALLGAASRGDIGEWFPSSDDRWRGAHGTDMLRHVWEALSADGWRLENADLTIVASQPRLGPYRDRMRTTLADALGCSVESVSLKATTTDGVGALGRAEGVLTLAVALLVHDQVPGRAI
jgi:2-C-methyl-D-erythritol 4-phosphate cytidylyltransferase / 2-C-methyl-D-erythritol 2,4-cyclodiphosphate synthase